MASPWSPWWLLSVIFFSTTLHPTDAGDVYVRPSGSDSSTCPYQPCFTFSEYVREADQYFLDNSTFIFLPGTHNLDTYLHVENVSNIEFRVSSSDKHRDDTVEIFLDPLVNISWTDCDDIEIADLIFTLGGNITEGSMFSSLLFERTSTSLLRLVLLGNNSLQTIAVRAVSSQVKFDDVEVVGVKGQSASALYAYNSTIDFVGNSRFVNNTITDGGTVSFFNSITNFYGKTLFIQNTAIPNSNSAAGAILCSNNSIVSLNGTISFQNNRALRTGRSIADLVATSGAILIQSSSKVTFGTLSEIMFSDNSAVLRGGAITLVSSELVIQGRGMFERNIAFYSGGAISAGLTSRIYCSGENEESVKFVNNSVTFTYGGAVDATLSVVQLENVYFEGNKARFGGAVFSSSSSVHIRACKFVRNQHVSQGGAVNVHNSSVNFDGRNVFELNSAIDAGAVNVYASNVTFGGENNFSRNTGFTSSGGIVLILSNATFSGSSTFFENQGDSGGGIYGIQSNVTLCGNSSFVRNRVDNYGGGIRVSNSTFNLTGRALFDKNGVPNGPALYADNSNLDIGGYVTISSGLPRKVGHVVLQGAINLLNCKTRFTGKLILTNNTADEGGCVHVTNSEVVFAGCIRSYKNRALTKGGVIFAKNSTINLESGGNCSIFQANTADRQGGVIYATDSSVYMSNSQDFLHNSAQYGGVLALNSDSKLILNQPLIVNFVQNSASLGGGAIYYEDTYSISQCVNMNENSRDSTLDCFIELNSTSSNIQLNFINNTANRAGTVLYGGNLDNCRTYVGEGVVNNCGVRVSGNYADNSVGTFKSISDIENVDNSTSEISSDPLRVCFCVGENLECENRRIETVRGKEFTLLAVTVGQGKGIIPSSVRAYVNNTAEIGVTQRIQNTRKECTVLKYCLSSNETSTKLTLFPDGPCRDICAQDIDIKFLPCPDGFTLGGWDCVCEDRIQEYTTNCSVDDDSIRRSSNKFWMGTVYDNDSYKGLILHPRCPFDYCVDTPIAITFDDLDIQCDHNHSGTLCGACKSNYSIAFGTLHCLRCSNTYFALIIPFALAGIALVTLLLLLNLSVAKGTINGLIFYANVIQANSSIFFPPGKTNVLTVFIAWLNLDLGIETCFFDGMNTYAFTWLQFLFPFYVWFLIGLIIVLSRFSDILAQALGKNPVASLATLFLLSYSKILRTVIVALSFTTLEYPNDIRSIVWLYDGNVPYFQRVDHIILGAFALAVLVILFLPYTILLISEQWLQTFSGSPVFSWLNKIKPFMDAYHAPFKKDTRYWTGALLLVRCILFLTFAFNALGNASTNLLAISSVTAGLAVLAWLHGRLYEKLYNDILEAAFILNLCIIAAATYHVEETGGSRAELAYTSVGCAFVIFICILLFHTYQRIQKTSAWKNLPEPAFKKKIVQKYFHKKASEQDNALEPADDYKPVEDSEVVHSPTTTVVELREPLLER